MKEQLTDGWQGNSLLPFFHSFSFSPYATHKRYMQKKVAPLHRVNIAIINIMFYLCSSDTTSGRSARVVLVNADRNVFLRWNDMNNVPISFYFKSAAHFPFGIVLRLHRLWWLVEKLLLWNIFVSATVSSRCVVMFNCASASAIARRGSQTTNGILIHKESIIIRLFSHSEICVIMNTQRDG